MIHYIFTTSSKHPTLITDKIFFDMHPSRRFFARPFASCDTFSPSIALFGEDENGELRELNLTIVARFNGFRKRLFFAVFKKPLLNTDNAIVLFLCSRNIDLVTMSYPVQ